MKRFIEIVTKVVLWAAFLLMPLLAHAGGLGIAPVTFIMGLAGLLFAISQGYLKPTASFLKQYLWVWPFLAFLIWANITALWSPYAASGLTNAHKILVIGVGLIFVPCALGALSSSQRDIFRHVFMAGSLLAIGLMTLDVLSGWGLSLMIDPPADGQSLSSRQSDSLMNVGHGFFTYVQYAAPLLVLFVTRLPKFWGWIAAIVFCFVLSIGSFLNLLNIAPVTLAAVLVIMALARFMLKTAVTLAMIGFGGLIIGAPLIGIMSEKILALGDIGTPESWDHRLRMWAYTWGEIKAHPFIGSGFDISRTYQETYTARAGYEIVIVSLHPHNVGLQIWLEVGLIGAVLLTLALAGLWQHAMQFAATPGQAAALAGIITSSALIGATTIGVWQFYWWGIIAFALATLVLIPRKSGG